MELLPQSLVKNIYQDLVLLYSFPYPLSQLSQLYIQERSIWLRQIYYRMYLEKEIILIYALYLTLNLDMKFLSLQMARSWVLGFPMFLAIRMFQDQV